MTTEQIQKLVLEKCLTHPQSVNQLKDSIKNYQYNIASVARDLEQIGYLRDIHKRIYHTTDKGKEYLGIKEEKPTRDKIRELIVKETAETKKFNSKSFAEKHKLETGYISDIARAMISDGIISEVQIKGSGVVIAETNDNTYKVLENLDLLKDRTALINITNNFGDNTQIVTGNQSSTISLNNHPTQNDNGSATNMTANADGSRWTRQNKLTGISICVVIILAVVGWFFFSSFK
jgi:hypothetical protein